MTAERFAAEIRMPNTIVDGDLLALGPQLEQIAGLRTVRIWVDEVADLFGAEIEKFAT
jgi:hypothetical protein